MDIVTGNNKIILQEDSIAPFTIERVGDKIILQEYFKILRMGLVSATWLLDAFKDVKAQYYREEQALVHNGQIILKVVCEVGYIYIFGPKIRFNMNGDVAVKLRDSLTLLLNK